MPGFTVPTKQYQAAPLVPRLPGAGVLGCAAKTAKTAQEIFLFADYLLAIISYKIIILELLFWKFPNLGK